MVGGVDGGWWVGIMRLKGKDQPSMGICAAAARYRFEMLLACKYLQK